MAEMVLKLDREVYGVKCPRQLANRDVVRRIGEPIELVHSIASYLRDAQAVAHEVANQLRNAIQAFTNTIRDAPTDARLGGSNTIRLSRINFAAISRVNRPPAGLGRNPANRGVKFMNFFVF